MSFAPDQLLLVVQAPKCSLFDARHGGYGNYLRSVRRQFAWTSSNLWLLLLLLLYSSRDNTCCPVVSLLFFRIIDKHSAQMIAVYLVFRRPLFTQRLGQISEKQSEMKEWSSSILCNKLHMDLQLGSSVQDLVRDILCSSSQQV